MALAFFAKFLGEAGRQKLQLFDPPQAENSEILS
jgi:hypothetical protein